MKRPPLKHVPVLLGIEGGGTRTTVKMVDGGGETLADFQTGPAVLSLMTDRELQWHLRDIADRLPQSPDALGIGLAGHSMGGQIVLTYAPTDPRIKVLADLAGVAYRGAQDTELEKKLKVKIMVEQ